MRKAWSSGFSLAFVWIVMPRLKPELHSFTDHVFPHHESGFHASFRLASQLLPANAIIPSAGLNAADTRIEMTNSSDMISSYLQSEIARGSFPGAQYVIGENRRIVA